MYPASFAYVALVFAAGAPDDGLSAWKADEQNIAGCFAAMDRLPELQAINGKFARRDPTPAQLADVSVASDAEAELLRLRIKKTRPCRNLRLSAVQTSYPLLEPAYKTLYYQADQVFEYLIEGWITFGEANRLSRESLVVFEARQRSFLALKSEKRRRKLSVRWDEALQRSHSNPPPSQGPVTCHWAATNLACTVTKS